MVTLVIRSKIALYSGENEAIFCKDVFDFLQIVQHSYLFFIGHGQRFIDGFFYDFDIVQFLEIGFQYILVRQISIGLSPIRPTKSVVFLLLGRFGLFFEQRIQFRFIRFIAF